MKRFLFTLSALALTASLASAECYYTSIEIAPTHAAVMKQAREYLGREPLSCTLGEFEKRTPPRKNTWHCKMTTETDCRKLPKNMPTAADVDYSNSKRPYIETVHPYTGGDYWGPNGTLYHCNNERECFRQ